MADQSGDVIALFNRSGEFQRILLSPENGIEKPRQMKAVDYQTLAVIDGSNTIKIFKFEVS